MREAKATRVSSRAAGRTVCTLAEAQALGGHHQSGRETVETPGLLSTQALAGCHQSGQAAVASLPCGHPGSCSLLSFLFLRQCHCEQGPHAAAPGHPGLPHQSHYIITRWFLLREQLNERGKLLLRFTAHGRKELIKKINHPSELGYLIHRPSFP